MAISFATSCSRTGRTLQATIMMTIVRTRPSGILAYRVCSCSTMRPRTRQGWRWTSSPGGGVFMSSLMRAAVVRTLTGCETLDVVRKRRARARVFAGIPRHGGDSPPWAVFVQMFVRRMTAKNQSLPTSYTSSRLKTWKNGNHINATRCRRPLCYTVYWSRILHVTIACNGIYLLVAECASVS